MPKATIKKSDLPRKTKAQKERALNILAALDARYPNAHCALHHRNAFELLIATILSAQCTDERVNIVTKPLFEQYPTPQLLCAAPLSDIEVAVKSTGFFRNKAKSLKETSRLLVELHGGEVPKTMQELLALRGVARKTANVVLGNAFGINVGVVVDTHVKRLSNRLGLSKHVDVGKIEKDLMTLFPQNRWADLSHLLIFHGRACCKARTNQHVENSICLEFGVKAPCKAG